MSGKLYLARSPRIAARKLGDVLIVTVTADRLYFDGRDLRLAVYCNDTVDFHRNILVRKIKLKNLAHHERVAVPSRR